MVRLAARAARGVTLIRRRLLVNGVVQGVGFRPFVYNLARDEDLAGFVSNTSAGVVIEVQGPVAVLDRFARRLRAEEPPLARIVTVDVEDLETGPDDTFLITASADTPGISTLIPPDVATCADCRREVRNPEDRRFGYPFTNCTNCGPRWTIIGRIPYDRPFTSMRHFAMCPECRAEYDDPGDRRFHAQPNACPECGPKVWIEGPVGAIPADDGPLTQAADALARHAVVAVKGLGGFHLAVRADEEEAVIRLRRRKNRAGKPLALMAVDVAAVRRLAILDTAEEALLTSPAAPIVLLERHADAPIADAVAPGHRRLGIMLPPTPLHQLLMDHLARLDIPAAVMTSGNLGDEPICIDNRDATERLSAVADAFVLHDRDILRRADDSVVQVVGGAPLVFRRSRGYAPVPVFVETGDVEPILAVGPELKNTVCLLKEGRGFLSPHIGDQSTLDAVQFFAETVATLEDVLECRPRVVAHDLHPGYATTRWARERSGHGRELIAVQHHHAHLAAVQAEHGLAGPAVGLIMDGTGYGSDGTIWGGEVLVGDAGGFIRAGHFEQVPLPGGDAAIRAPWRQAVSYLRHVYGPGFFAEHPAEFPFQSDRPVGPVLEMLQRDVNSPLTSSCGRLFDAVAAVVGPWTEATYEAQAAIEFMALTDHGQTARAPAFAAVLEDLDTSLAETSRAEPNAAGSCFTLPVASFLRAVREARRAGLDPDELSARFHRTLIDVLGRAAAWTCDHHGLDQVVLGGGVFQNEILVVGVEKALHDAGLQVWRPQELPAGDGAVALGQAVVAAAVLHARAEQQ
ncbi:MAG: carbamoyltransferase HypF [bacterium]|nr:carbamoyltransferase HypF [bacterium]